MLLLVPAIESNPRILTRGGVVFLGTVADLDPDGRPQRRGTDGPGNVQGNPLQSGFGGLGSVAGSDKDLLDTLEGDHEHLPSHGILRALSYPIVLMNSRKRKTRIF